MTQQETILSAIEPELADTIVQGRRDVFTKYAKAAGIMTSAPLVLALASNQAFGQSMPQVIVDTLNFALTLEYLEAAFYNQGNKSGVIPSEYRTVFRTIGQHENAHVKLLKGVLGSAAVAAPGVDFTAGGKYADVWENFDTFLTLSQTFEDLGVAAYKGQAGNLMGSREVLTVALQIHSVEARHASEVRRIGLKFGWDGGFDKPMSKSAVLAAATPFLA
ncbi:MAG: ferritin-like domain-containing protein [Candidatus Devosia phytovorans]|uniref:Ferritin-like domain-containing protein n=1 Tax=Candidatus Devosia phytovorans TaxID=3121372 RepID=A0AAJ5VW48_9HYPH|nr:ferritin-like domain-containing protein [Devosia sp.]WEK05879.1 MAG: ferritin-like domain-containing protein [Devosia sp.]